MTRNDSAAQRWLEHTVSAEEAGLTVQDVLTGPLGISRRMIQKLTRNKGVLRNRKAPFLGAKVRAGDVIAARVGFAEDAGLEPVPMDLDIVYEDADVLAVNKPPFLLVHPTSPAHRNTLSHGIAFHFQQQRLRAKVRPVHRIDRDTSGLVLMAKNAMAHQRLDAQLRDRTLQREYLALVDGVVGEDDGVIDAPIGRDRARPQLRVVDAGPRGEAALTRFWVVERLNGATLLRLELETGRTHQIRVHLTHVGHPVLGDRQYGRAGTDLLRRQALHASRLSFLQPTSGARVDCEAPLPEDLEALRQQLRQGS